MGGLSRPRRETVVITREEAMQKADAWLNAGKSAEERREVGVYEFEHGYVVWPVEPRRDPTELPMNVGGGRGVIDKETGELSYWPSISADMIAQEYSAKRQRG